MDSSMIRSSFIEYFKNKGHHHIKSASLMPNTPNLLFTNAGMNSFASIFLGDRSPDFSRITNTQKCIRAGGSHNDLNEVGYDNYHHTFFEMLGNWSFGNYFKKKTIEWSWDFLTNILKFPKDRLYITVYRPLPGEPASLDIESYNIWKDIIRKEGLNFEHHIHFGSKVDNFWMMGSGGPCGPCSEIHMDCTPLGDGYSLINKNSPWCIEIWNLVFIQFNATQEGRFEKLLYNSVDTGMGIERLAGVISTTKYFNDYTEPPSNYNSDLFAPILDLISNISGIPYGCTKNYNDLSPVSSIDVSFRVIADHMRALCCSISDGIVPGSKGRNYVIRKIFRRTLLYMKKIDIKLRNLLEIIPVVLKTLGCVFQGLNGKQSLIRGILENELNSFSKTLNEGFNKFDLLRINNNMVSGKQMFLLYDTHGLPVDLIEILAREKGYSFDRVEFEKSMKYQRQLSDRT